MNDEACRIFLNLITLSVRMMPVFVCLEPKVKSRENIASISVYLWVIMTFLQSLFHIPDNIFVMVQGLFSFLYFLILLLFFQGGVLEKTFLYLSAWLFAVLSDSLNELIAWALLGRTELTYSQICVIVSALSAFGFYLGIRLWMKEAVKRLFAELSVRAPTLLLAYPTISLLLLFVGTSTIFSRRALATGGFGAVVFFFILCSMIVGLYVLILNSLLELMERRKVTEELEVAKHLLYQQRELYHQILDYIEQVRIIRHDFRHHIHALQNMDKDTQTQYLSELKKELDSAAMQTFCQNQAVNGLLQEFSGRCRENQVHLETHLDLPGTIPIDDLTLCIVIGNLLENALDACRCFTGPRFVHIRGRWDGDHLKLLVENSFDGQVRKIGGELLSRKQEGGLGLLSIRRTLSCPGDDFEVSYGNSMFTAMATIAPRAVPTFS
ncbi:GHKL domain-containing protein [Oscillibacter sp.]|uniref:sensor histidine kinase n=1 Tax=Oscillibacter sp. TaxID=1945593 RepID=UPI0028AE0BD6|nr:GHKL domain-containing protein [Oscillibacter sp.]